MGDVFTVEPGIYISPDLLGSLPDTPKNRAFLAKIRPAVERYKGIGVRLEDDYALTEKGLEWLSEGSPREMDRVEALMRGREIELPWRRRLWTADGREMNARAWPASRSLP